MNYEELKSLALESGFTHTAPLDTATIELKQDVRDMCAQGCQQYARRWSCPPGCGTLDQLRGSIYCYKEGILVQTVTKLEDEFDWDGMIKELQEFENPVINHLHLWIRKCLEQQTDVELLADKLLETYPGLIFICDEIGNGIVPMDALERDYRERTGRLQIRIAKKAERVERIVCGISQRLK